VTIPWFQDGDGLATIAAPALGRGGTVCDSRGSVFARGRSQHLTDAASTRGGSMMSCFAWPAWGEPRKLIVRGRVHVAGGKRCRSPKHGGLSVLLGWKAPRVEATALSVTGRRGCDLGLSGRTCQARAGRGQLGGDSGVRRRAEESARTKTPSANSSASSKRAGRRETPGPPVSWPRVQAHGSRAERKLRREAGSYRNVGAR